MSDRERLRRPNSEAERAGQVHLAEALALIPPLEGRLAAAARPTAKSLAVRDGRTALGRIPYDLGLAALSIGADHLGSWHALVVRGQTLPAFAYWSLLRAALEGAVRAKWLCEPSSEAERFARGVGAQLDDYNERRKLEQDIRKRHPAQSPMAGFGHGKPAVERIKDLEVAARRQKVKPIRPLGRTDLFDRYVFPAAQIDKHGPLGRILYRLLSGPAHGYQWSVLVSAMELMDEPMPRPDTFLARVTGNIEWAASATTIAAMGFSDAVTEFERYAGVDGVTR